MLRLKHFDERGSVLIATVLLASLFSVLSASMSFQIAQHLDLLKRTRSLFEARCDLQSGFYLASERILDDPEPHEDSFQDEWFGTIPLPEAWPQKVSVTIEDEESKLNLNSAPESLLKEVFKVMEEKVHFGGDAKDMIKQILKKRAQGRIRSFEELYLFEDVEKEDLEKIRPYVTVYSETGWLNLNTLQPSILNALIGSLTQDALLRDEVFEKISAYREKIKNKSATPFRSEDLAPARFAKITQLEATPAVLEFLGRFLLQVTCDSRTYRLLLKSHQGLSAVVVMRESCERTGMEILSWHEELNAV